MSLFHGRRSMRGSASAGPTSLTVLLVVLALLALGSIWAGGCESSGATGESTTSSSENQGVQSGDVDGRVGTVIIVANVEITVNALEATFQPAQPVQRLSDGSPSAPASGESFYQAYVRVKNLDTAPVRVDPLDFACMVGTAVVGVEPTRSGPLARSLLKNTSLDLILTFKAKAGFVPELLYSPPWYQGTVRVIPSAGGEEGTTTTTS